MIFYLEFDHANCDSYFIAAWNSCRLLTDPFPFFTASIPAMAARAAAIVVMYGTLYLRAAFLIASSS